MTEQRRKPANPMIPYLLSFSDLEKVGIKIYFDATLGEGNLKISRVTQDNQPLHHTEFEKILYTVGMDIKFSLFITEEVTHRDKTGQVVKCRRLEGIERCDQKWRSSGLCSEEVFMRTSRMGGLGEEAARLNR